MNGDEAAAGAPMTVGELDEFLRLLCGAGSGEIDGTRSVLERGQSVDLAVGVWPSERHEGHFDLLISAFRRGRGRLPLHGCEVYARDRAGDMEILRYSTTSQRGDLAIDDLPSGVQYRLGAATHFGHSGRVVPVEAPPALAAAPEGSRESSAATFDCSTGDGRVRARLYRSAGQQPDVMVAETTDPDTAGREIAFYLVGASGRIEFSVRSTLGPVSGRGDLWEARWEGRLDLPEPCEFAFEVMP